MHLTSLQQASYRPIEHMPSFGLGKTLGQANQDFQALSESLTAGDVTGAQSALTDLKKLMQSAGSIGAATSVQNGIASLTRDLGSGDVASAKQDAQQLKSDLAVAVANNRGPGLPVRLPGGGLLKTGLLAARTVGHLLA